MHRLLQRQIARYLKDAQPLPPEFVAAVDAAFVSADADRLQIERSLELMSQELTERNEALRNELAERRRAEAALEREKEEQRALINKLEEAQNQLLQSDKMASIGQLAAGVAHEINNPIGFIHSNSGTLRDYVAGLLELVAAFELEEAVLDDTAKRRIDAIKERVDLCYLRDDVMKLLGETQEGIQRVRRIVQDLKDFSHVDEGCWQRADLHRGLDSTLNIVNNEIKYVADVVKDYGDIPEVECLPVQLNQVFLNLLVNAAQSMNGKRGVITVRTGVEDDAHVFVEIADDGAGILPVNIKRIFDPFFTTKPVGTGTGLGLSVSYGIVTRHGGRIEVSSDPGLGTTFRVMVPICRRTP